MTKFLGLVDGMQSSDSESLSLNSISSSPANDFTESFQNDIRFTIDSLIVMDTDSSEKSILLCCECNNVYACFSLSLISLKTNILAEQSTFTCFQIHGI